MSGLMERGTVTPVEPAAPVRPLRSPDRAVSQPRGATPPAWPRKLLRRSVGVLAGVALFTSLNVYLLPHEWYVWLGLQTFGPGLLEHNLYAHPPVVDHLHRAVGVLYLLLGLFQFSDRSRRRPGLHRWSGRVVVLLAVALTGSGFLLTRESFGGWPERMANLLFGGLVLVALAQAYRLARRRDFRGHREWMIRMFALSLGVMTLRLYYGPVTRTLPMSYPDALVLCTWLGYVTNAVVAELWIRHTRTATRLASAPEAA